MFADLYEERDVFTRMQAKILRTFRRMPNAYTDRRRVLQIDARDFPRIREIRAVITSPPYMNALDYVRDNRLRLWFLERSVPTGIELVARDRDAAFLRLMRAVCVRLAPGIERGGRFIFVVGDATRGNGPKGNTAVLTQMLFNSEAALGDFKLNGVYHDRIPDIRRSRRECSGTKVETILIYRKKRLKSPRSTREKYFGKR